MLRFDHLIRSRWDAFTIMWNQLFEILTRTKLEIIDLAISMKSDKNKISISLLTPRSDKLNNKASEVNNRLINMCSHRNIAYIDHSSSIQQNHINKSKVHLNRFGTKVFANTFSKFLSEYYWWGHDNNKKIHLVQVIYNKELKVIYKCRTNKSRRA